jgi:hypothetical protein
MIDLMGNEPWTDADITARTEAMLRTTWPENEEKILNRDWTAALSGLAPMTPELQGRALAFKDAAEAARLAGVQARADLALLHEVQALEAAQARLALPIEEVTDGPTARGGLHAEERAAAQAVIDAASLDARNLALLRAPIPEPEPQPEEQP